jgi:hypothetical protein
VYAPVKPRATSMPTMTPPIKSQTWHEISMGYKREG